MTWQKNEPTAAKRRTLLIVTDDGGYPVSPGLDLVAGGVVFVVGLNAPNADLATGTMTNVRRPLAMSDFTFTAATTDIITRVAHGLQTGDGPVRAFSSTTLPAGLAAATDYYVIKIDDDTFYLATSLANAYAGARIDITSTGTGTHTLDLTGVGTKRGLWGHFVYEAPQAELNHDAPEMAVIVDGVISGTSMLRMNGGGAQTHVEMTVELASIWDLEMEDGHSYGDGMRAVARGELAPYVEQLDGTQIIKSIDGTRESHRGTVTSSGRSGMVINDLAP